MESFVSGDLKISAATGTSNVLRLDWSGRSTDRDPGKILGGYFDGVIKAAKERALGLELHFEGLDYFNSSTISFLIRFIQQLREASIKLVVVYDDSLKWQNVSFGALRIFEKPDGLLTFQTAKGGAQHPRA